ncbi:hypothetical protein [Dinghuibacter silviterrae]|uniref:Outer membrane beta-barrel porin/alpha-amylase n=1 Tax=Dinghuibacter silviterrae TaxID=1539049 RepID=A0A4R8DIN2_9BACT|nr:hypothetical protein [Dinghuibacter silviterrae]TDW97435.1 hypothetical protein EDB95_5284 [Dinghuibacter silviterrae]
MRTFIYLLFLILLSQATFAQSKDTTHKEKTHVIAGVTYNSGLNYYGRVDSLHTKGVLPFVGIDFRNGLYMHSTFVFIQNSVQSEYAATLLEAGYNFTGHSGHWAGNLSASQFFYRPGTDLVQSVIHEMATASLTNLNKIVDITVGINAKWSSQVDPGAQAGLDHIIRFQKVFGKGILVLDPSAYVYAGTQHFTQTYYEQKNFLFIPVSDQQITTQSSQFNVLAYEFSLPVVFRYQKFYLILSPAYVLPQNLLGEPGQNLFYLTATVKFAL